MKKVGLLATWLVSIALCSIAYGQDEAAAVETQAEIDHLFFYIGGARRCRLMTDNGLQDAMKTIVDFKQRYAAIADKVNSAEDFIAQVATNDPVNNKAYIMECRKSGAKQQLAMSDWLRTELVRYRSTP